MITGEPWPDGQPMEARFAGRKVIYVNGEGAEQLLKARLDGWQFDKSKLRLMVPPRGHMLDFTKREDRDPPPPTSDCTNCTYRTGRLSMDSHSRIDPLALLDRIDLRRLAEAAGARFARGDTLHCPRHGGDNL